MEFPQRFRSRRLLLTRIECSDFQEFARMRRDPRVTQTLGDASAEQAVVLVHKLDEHWRRHGYGWWVARDPATGRYVGCGGLRAVMIDGVTETEVAYGVRPEYWGQGYATELARVAVAQGFVRLGVREMVSFTLPENHASRRVMSKAGFGYEREFVHAGRPHVLYRLAVEAWRLAPLRQHTAPAGRVEPLLQPA